MKQMAEKKGVTEELKVQDQMKWVVEIPTFGFAPKSQL